MMGIARKTSANQDRDATPEIALLYFRRFLRIARRQPVEAPRRGAREGARRAGLPARRPCRAPRNRPRSSIRPRTCRSSSRAMPALRACVAKLPAPGVQRHDRPGPRRPRPAPRTAASTPCPPRASRSRRALELEPITPGRSEIAAVRCLAPLARARGCALPPSPRSATRTTRSTSPSSRPSP